MGALISFPDRMTTSGLTASNFSGFFNSSFPATNLASPSFYLVSRTTDTTLAHTTFTVVFNKVVDISAVAILSTNLTKQAGVRLSLYDSQSTSLYNSDWMSAFPAWADNKNLSWGQSGVYDGLVGDDVFLANRRDVIIDTKATYPTTTIQFDISDANNPAGYIQIARMFAGGGWRPSINMAYGQTLQWEDTSLVQETYAGRQNIDKRFKRRVARFSLNNLPEGEMRYWSNEIGLRQGISDPLLFVRDPTKTNLTPDSFLGRMRSLSTLEAAAFNASSEAFEIEEVIG